MRRSESGQALVEWALLLPLYGGLIAMIVAYGQSVVIRHELIAAVREAAFLYSSGRMTKDETKTRVQQTLLHGAPALNIPLSDIQINRYPGLQAMLFRLDQVVIVYRATRLMKVFHLKDLREGCVIKHAPSYWVTDLPGFNLGPPVSW